MTVKLFQDVAGTIPAVLAGQPVGFIKRTKGSDDAKQAIALSKPTYARWPKTGKVNIADYAAVPSINNLWVASQTASGITATKVAWGVEAGYPYVDYHVTGIATSNAFVGITQNGASRVPGEFMRISATARRIAGDTVLKSAEGLRLIVQRVGSDGIASTNLAAISDLVNGQNYDVNLTARGILSQDPTAALMQPKAEFRLETGTEVDAVWRIKMYQVSSSEPQMPFQFNYGPNDIIETGVADLWHLYNDGGDSLNVTLPAGTYGLATIGIDRQIVIGTFVSDGTTPVNILRHERQLDVSYRLGPYSFAEELAIRDAWGRKYA